MRFKTTKMEPWIFLCMLIFTVACLREPASPIPIRSTPRPTRDYAYNLAIYFPAEQMAMPLNEEVLDVFSRANLENIYGSNQLWAQVCLDGQKQEIIDALRFSIRSTIVIGDARGTMGWPCFLVQVKISPAMLAPISNMDVERIFFGPRQSDPIIDKLDEKLFWTVIYWPNNEIIAVRVEVTEQFGEIELENLRLQGLDIDPTSWEPVQEQKPGGSYEANLRIGSVLDVAAHDNIESLIREYP